MKGVTGWKRLCWVGWLGGILPGLAHASPVVAGFERFYREENGDGAAAVEGGLLLLNELNCVACHAPPAAWAARLPGRGKIVLTGVGARLEPKFLGEFVQRPQQAKPGTLMPRIVTNAEEGGAALAAYLGSLPTPAPAQVFPPGDRARGERLFNSVGCVACHAPGSAPTAYASVPLGLAAHYERNALAAFIQNPLHLRPAGRMPATELSDKEAADLAEFLGTKSWPGFGSAASGEIAAGRAQFVARNCAACHLAGEKEPASRVAAAAALATLRVDRGCLSAAPGARAVDFSLDSRQITALAAALRVLQRDGAPPAQTAVQKVQARLEQLNCLACHEWRGRGGVEAARATRFTTLDSGAESLGELGRLPPTLDQAGRKLTPEWIAKLLWGEYGGVRPYLSVRMPRFGRESSADLMGWLAEACQPEQPMEIDTSGGKGHQRSAAGRTLLGIGAGGLGCVNCHGIKDRQPNGIHAINLTHTARRLQPEYFKALLLDPQKIQPGTIMPPLFTARAEADKEIEAIWTYFKELDQSPRLPEGLESAEAFELKPRDEGRPIIFRTFLEGAGVQAVAVGDPSGVNAAFDSYEVRWALVWRGRFLDAKSNWEERPMKPVKPLGENARLLPAHVPFAQLSEPNEPWPTAFGRKSGYTFLGYRLGRDGVPTFRYAVGDLEVEDTLRPARDGAAWRRTLIVRGRGTGWYFRGTAIGATAQPVIWKDGAATIEELVSF